MSTGYVLYNKKAGNKKVEWLKSLENKIDKPAKFIEIEKVKNYQLFLSDLGEDDFVIICGGDGTLNRFINDVSGIEYKCEVLYYPSGTGNDFAHEIIGKVEEPAPFAITKYIKNLPTVTVNGCKYHFINGVGYGIDGYCCEVGDKQREMSDKPVNYTAIAIKGLLFNYKPTGARVTVDGVTRTYKKVWLTPTMLGKYYGGGMMPTPAQDRESGMLSTLVFHGSGKLKTLAIFPSIFKGEHIKHTKYIDVLQGSEITVEFDRPTPLQIDGETILGVTSYTACHASQQNAADLVGAAASQL